MAKILVMEDEATIAMVLDLALADLGHEVFVAPDCSSARDWIRRGLQPDLAIVDLFLKGVNSAHFITHAREQGYTLPIILVTGASHIKEALPPPGTYQALFSKPFELDALIRTVIELLKE